MPVRVPAGHGTRTGIVQEFYTRRSRRTMTFSRTWTLRIGSVGGDF